MIRVSRVDMRYGREIQALQAVTCKVARGELVFLTGPSGAGKTTLLRLLCGLERPSAGEVVVFNQSLGQLGESERRRLRRRMGLVLQESLLLPDLTVEENAGLPLRVAGLPSRLIHQRVGVALERLGVGRLARRLPATLSAGEAQRVAIARALVNQPLLLLADEPTGNLDPAEAQRLMSLLTDLAGDGATLLVATHDPLLCRDPRARVMTLAGGRLRTELRPEAV